MTTIRTTFAAAAIALGGLAAPAAAQTMSEGYDMLTAALANAFERLGIETDGLDGLSLGQIAAIQSIVTSGDNSGDVRNRVEAIINQN